VNVENGYGSLQSGSLMLGYLLVTLGCYKNKHNLDYGGDRRGVAI
jgi:hypothetical protein